MTEHIKSERGLIEGKKKSNDVMGIVSFCETLRIAERKKKVVKMMEISFHSRNTGLKINKNIKQ